MNKLILNTRFHSASSFEKASSRKRRLIQQDIHREEKTKKKFLEKGECVHF